MNIQAETQLWNQVMIRVLDVRKKRIGRGDELNAYLTPASTFLFAAQGQGELWVDDNVWLTERFHLQHIGKGGRLTVRTDEWLDVYLILYKTILPAAALREFHIMLKTDNPFEENWGFVPSEPMELFEGVESMLGSWQQADEGLARLKAKGDFIRFVHAVLRQRAGGVKPPSLAEQVIRYLTRNYRQQISLEQLARQLNYSPQYISRKFKEQTGSSPMDYIVRLRLDEARALLLSATASLQEIAAYVGYPDLMYFSRMFKKHTGITPGQYRKRYGAVVSNCAMNRINPYVVRHLPTMYNSDDNDIHYQYQKDGASFEMSKHARNLSAILLLCLTMIVSACGEAADKAGSKNEASGSAPGSAAAAGTDTANATRTVTSAFGEVEVPAHPQRVAALAYLGTVLALDVKPVTSDALLMKSPYLDGKLDGVEEAGESLEKLIDLQPDLIVTINPSGEVVEKYNKIAPTVSIPYNSFTNIQEEMSYFGDLLDKKEEAQRWIADFEKRAGELRDKVQAAVAPGKTVSVMQEYDGTVFLFGPKSGRGGRIMYEILGMKPPAAIPESALAESYYEFSLEKLHEYTGDYLILTSDSTLAQLQADPVWGKLPPIRDNRVFLWKESESWYRDPIAVDGQINSLANWLVETAGR